MTLPHGAPRCAAKCSIAAVLCLLLCAVSGAAAFSAPAAPFLGLHGVAKAACKSRAWSKRAPFMCSAGDGDSERDALNKKLDDVAAARARGLNDAIEDEEVQRPSRSRSQLADRALLIGSRPPRGMLLRAALRCDASGMPGGRSSACVLARASHAAARLSSEWLRRTRAPSPSGHSRCTRPAGRQRP